MTRVPAKIVPLLDVSDSMQFYQYLTPAKVALDTFVNMFQLGDMFCILSFSDSVYNVYPSTTTLATYSSPSVLQAASTAIQAVKSVRMTNIGDAIVAAKNVLQPQPEPRGIVLLSDGEWNRGPDPMKVLP
ncbi:MAG TPA: vWA domain-containing protein, partial [Thermoanaerobaculia bacterium]|nr:vWA domain-containing protein [Thermoanaerobaculia bacterium]